MSNLVVGARTPSLVQGVSQQPDGIRQPTQAQEVINGWGTVVDGMRKRPPTRHVAKLSDDQYGTPLMHVINRDPSERYILSIQPDTIEAWETDGTPVHVELTADLEYLSTRSAATANLAESETFDSTSSWARTGGPAELVLSGERGPLGWGSWCKMGTWGGAGDQTWSKTPEGSGVWIDDRTQFSVYVTQDDVEPGHNFFLFMNDVTGTTQVYEAEFEFDSNGVLSKLGTTAPSGSEPKPTHNFELVSPGVYRVWMSVKLNGIDTLPGDSLTVGIRTTNEPVTSYLWFWGAMLEFAVGAPGPGPGAYATAAEDDLKALTVQDNTFITNSTKTTAMDAALSSTPLRGDSGHFLCFVKLALLDSQYWLRIDDTTGGGGVNTYYVQTVVVNDISGTPAEFTASWCQGGPNANNAAECASGGGVWKASPTAGNDMKIAPETGGIAGRLQDFVVATGGVSTGRLGAVLECWDAGGSPFDEVYAEANRSKDAIVIIPEAGGGETIEDISDLPVVARDDFKVKIAGDPSTDADDYYLKFVANKSGALTRGYWEETLAHSITYKFDATTMPHRLVRKQDDSLGTITGVPFAKYFEFLTVPWDDMAVGDKESNEEPSFIGEKIRNTVFARNRLGFLSGQNVIWSETGSYFNFWRTTVRTLLDADPIDTQVTHTEVSNLYHALPIARNILLFSDRGQFVQEGEPVLTGSTVSTKPLFSYEILTTPAPVEQGKSASMFSRQGDFTIVRELYPTTASSDTFESEETTAQVPRYISGDVKDADATTLQDLMVVLSDGDRSKLYTYTWYWLGQEKAQSAWTTLQFDPGDAVRGIGFIENELFMLVQRADGLYIDGLLFAKGQVDTGGAFVTHLDRRTNGDDLTKSYNAVTEETTFTLPWDIPSGAVVQAVSQASSLHAGKQWKVVATDTTTPGSHTVTVEGRDSAAESIWLGIQYEFRYTFSQVWPQMATPRGGLTPGLQQPFKIVNGILLVEDSSSFTVEVKPGGRPLKTYSFTGQGLGLETWTYGDIILSSGRFRFDVLAQNTDVTIEIVNDTPLPSNIVSAEWETEAMLSNPL